MRAVLVAVGSRGDVVPFIALGQALQSRGHEVTLISHTAHHHLIPPGLSFVGVTSDPHQLLAGPATQALRSINIRELVEHRQSFSQFLTSFLEPAREVLPEADVLVASTFAIAAVDVALQLGIPVVRAHTWPQTGSGFGPLPLVRGSWHAPAVARWACHRAMSRAEVYLAGVTGEWQGRRLVLTGAHPVTLTTNTHGSLHAYSSAIAESPQPGAVVTGWWRPQEEEALTEGTRRILSETGPWIAVGFGSMPKEAFARVIQALDQALATTGTRAVVQSACQDIPTGPRIRRIGDEPHAELFRHVDAVVHHGGSGTTGAAVHAGVPSVVIPYFADQHYWAHRAHRAGVAARPMKPDAVSPTSLAARLQQVTSLPMQRRTQHLMQTVRDEPGVQEAVRYLERITCIQAPTAPALIS